MAKRTLTPEDLAAIREQARRWGKIICKQAFGEQGPTTEVDLTTMEEAAVAALRGLVAGTLEASTAQQAAQLGTHQPCPDCGQLCLVRHEPRTVTVRGGTFEQQEPVCSCTRCRRAFFPSASPAGPGQPRLQSTHPPQNRGDGRSGQIL